MTYGIKDILRLEVAPALGCTEPVAIALAAAAAASLLPPGEPTAVEVQVDPNIYKNGLAVAIPGTPGLSGLDTAAAMGVFGGDPHLRLEVLAPVDDAALARAAAFVRAGKVTVTLHEAGAGLFVRAVVHRAGASAAAEIRGTHDHIVSLERDGRPVSDSPLLAGTEAGAAGGVADLERWLSSLSLAHLLALIDDLDADDRAFLQEGLRVNLRLADHGLKYGPGLGVGRTLERLVRQGLIREDMVLAARRLTSAAADARMAGVKLPAMSSAGSGNHGLTAILPIRAVSEFITSKPDTVLEAIAFSHIITAYIKAFTGRLSAVCGCSVAAGAGAAAGITYLLGGDLRHIAGAITNLAMDLAGVICDGAKAGCALKLATAAGTAVQAALFSLQGVTVSAADGIIGASPEQTMQNLGTLSTQGMIETDRTILKIMLEKKFARP